LKKVDLFLKLGGSCITDKMVPDSMFGDRITAAARMIVKAINDFGDPSNTGSTMSLILAHGAGSYGHIPADRYAAVNGVHPDKGWKGFHEVRKSMIKMNLEFLEYCNRGGLYPITVQPSSVVIADNGIVSRIDTKVIEAIMNKGMIPLIHGDIVIDETRGFTIASTESLLDAMSEVFVFERIVTAGDTDGVLNERNETIPFIDSNKPEQVYGVLTGAESTDVTGGMKTKVEKLVKLVSRNPGTEARIIRFTGNEDTLYQAILGRGGGGTVIRYGGKKHEYGRMVTND